jgi:hypothetical protein
LSGLLLPSVDQLSHLGQDLRAYFFILFVSGKSEPVVLREFKNKIGKLPTVKLAHNL